MPVANPAGSLRLVICRGNGYNRGNRDRHVPGKRNAKHPMEHRPMFSNGSEKQCLAAVAAFGTVTLASADKLKQPDAQDKSPTPSA